MRGHLGGYVAAWATAVAGRRSGLEAEDRPLATGAPGRPRPTDFWVTLAGSAVIAGLLLFAAAQATAGQ